MKTITWNRLLEIITYREESNLNGRIEVDEEILLTRVKFITSDVTMNFHLDEDRNRVSSYEGSHRVVSGELLTVQLGEEEYEVDMNGNPQVKFPSKMVN